MKGGKIKSAGSGVQGECLVKGTGTRQEEHEAKEPVSGPGVRVPGQGRVSPSCPSSPCRCSKTVLDTVLGSTEHCSHILLVICSASLPGSVPWGLSPMDC